MAKQKVNPAPAGTTGWVSGGKFYESGTEIEVGGDLEKRLKEKGVIGDTKGTRVGTILEADEAARKADEAAQEEAAEEAKKRPATKGTAGLQPVG